jgi:hypothetical protein
VKKIGKILLAGLVALAVQGYSMGSGSRFKVRSCPGFGLGVYIDTFPFAFSVNITLVVFNITIGLGKAYDD